MRANTILVWAALAGLMGGTTAFADEALAARRDPTAMSVADISACMRANIVDRGSMRDFEVASTDREGVVRSFKAKLFWRPGKDSRETRMTLQVTAPETHAGTSYLLVSQAGAGEDQVHVYLPALDRVQLVQGAEMSQPLWGTDFTFAEVKQVQGLLQRGETTRRDDATVLGRKAFVLDTVTDAQQTGYSHVVSFVDQASCTLLRSELFSDGAEPRKILEADLSTLIEVDPWWVMLGYRMRNPAAGTETDLKLSDLYLLEELPTSLFAKEGFYKRQQ